MQRIFDRSCGGKLRSPRSLLSIAEVSGGLAKLAIALGALIRHPSSLAKQRIYRCRVLDALLIDQKSKYWLTNTIQKPKEVSLKFFESEALCRSSHVPRIAAICHIYYLDTAEMMNSYLRNIPFQFDLFISTDTEIKKRELQEIFALGPANKVEIRTVPNIGRDIAPKLLSFRNVIRSYDFLVFLHGKKSAHSDELGGWAPYLYDSLLGSPSLVKSILDAFISIPQLGIIAPQHFLALRDKIDWGQNGSLVLSLLDRLVPFAYCLDEPDFPSGSMFWSRASAMEPLLSLDLTYDDFHPEKGQIDGTLAHAVERLLFVSCELSGLRWLKVVRNPSSAIPCEVLTVNSAQEVKNFLASSERRIVFDMTGARGAS